MKPIRQPNPLRQFVSVLLVVALAPLVAGCDTFQNYPFTVSLWSVGGANRCMPAPDPAMKLYRKTDDQDVLVTYDELRERDGRVVRRAFFFRPNVDRLAQGKKPHFGNANTVVRSNLVAVAGINGTNAAGAGPVTFQFSESAKEFTIVWDGRELG